MSKQGISTGSAPNDGTGDTLLAGTIKINDNFNEIYDKFGDCLLYTSPSPRDMRRSRMPSSA